MEQNLIYDDLATQGDLGAIINDLQTRNNELQQHVASLEADVTKLSVKITEMRTVQDNLTKNISELFYTAKHELALKDRRISELQTQLDDMIFKRTSQPRFGLKRKGGPSDLEEHIKKPRCETLESSQFQSVSENFGKIDRNTETGSDPREKVIHDSKTEGLNSSDGCLIQESELMRKAHSRDDSYSSYQANLRNHRDARIDNRETINDHQDFWRRNRYNYKHNWKRSRVNRGRKRGYRGTKREHRESRRGYRDFNGEFRRNDANVSVENRQRSSEYNDCVITQHRNDQTVDSTCSEDNNRKVDCHSGIEPVFSTSQATPRILCDTVVSQDDSKEEGEFSDGESKNGQKMDFGKNLPYDNNKSFNVNKFIRKQKGMLKGEVNVERTEEQSKANDNNQENKKKDSIIGNSDKTLENICGKSGRLEKKKAIKAETVKLENEKKELKNASNQIILTKDNDHMKNNESIEEHVDCNREKNSPVNVISQVILQEGVKNTQPTGDLSVSQIVEQRKGQFENLESKEKSRLIVPKMDERRRESRVPRNLTDGLNIDTEKSKRRLFGSPDEKVNPSLSDHFSPSHTIDLSHDGQIPGLKLFSSSGTADPDSSDGTKSSNPVTEFQIFKTNFPCLEKANSVSSISEQIQTLSTKDKIILVKKVEKSNSSISEIKKEKQKKLSEATVSKLAVSGDETFRQSTGDVCNISLDSPNMDMGLFKTEKFPNLIAQHSDSKDMCDMLLTPLKENVVNVSKKPMNLGETSKNRNNTNENEKNPFTSNKMLNSASSSSAQIQLRANATSTIEEKEILPPKEVEDSSNQQKNEKLVTEQSQVSIQEVTEHENGFNKSLVLPTSDKRLNEHSPVSPSKMKHLVVILTPLNENMNNVFKKSTNPSSTGKSKSNTVSPPTPSSKKPSKIDKKKSTSLSGITAQIQTTTVADTSKDENILSQQANEKSKPLGEKVKNIETSEEIISKQYNNSGDICSTTKSDSKDMSDLLLAPVEQTERTDSKVTTNTVKTRSNTNVNMKVTDETSPNTSKKPLNTSNRKSNASSSITETSESSTETEKGIPPKKGLKKTPVLRVKVEGITKQKKRSEESISIIEDKFRKSTTDISRSSLELPNLNTGLHKSATILNSIAHSESKDIADLLSKPVVENVKHIPKKSANSNSTCEANSITNVNEKSMDVTVPDLSEKSTKEGANENKKLIFPPELSDTSLNSLTETKPPTNIRRRRCVVKWVQ